MFDRNVYWGCRVLYYGDVPESGGATDVRGSKTPAVLFSRVSQEA